jgi:hypothetical protein
MDSNELFRAHGRVKDFEWNFSYESDAAHHPTSYKIPRTTSDPFRHLCRDYRKMEPGPTRNLTHTFFSRKPDSEPT